MRETLDDILGLGLQLSIGELVTLAQDSCLEGASCKGCKLYNACHEGVSGVDLTVWAQKELDRRKKGS